MQHTESYLDVNLALVTADYRSREFKSLDSIRGHGELRIGFVDLSRGFAGRLKKAFPGVNLVEIKNNRDFFVGKHPELDALLISAETGSAFTLMYPNFEVVVPNGLSVRLPLFYAIANRDAAMRDFLEHWIKLRQKDGTSQEYYEHWVLGKTEKQRKPRWSIIRDHLHWID
jgi:ABC-type amino acid transport substrate-binding protein